MLKIGILRNPTHEWGIIAEWGIKWGKMGNHLRVGQFGNYVWMCYIELLLMDEKVKRHTNRTILDDAHPSLIWTRGLLLSLLTIL